MGVWPSGIVAVTLFVDDLEAAKHFYGEVFDLPVVFEDDDSVAYKFPNTIVNLLNATAASELIAPAAVARGEEGSRFVLTIEVDDVDARCEALASRGAELLNVGRGACEPPASEIPPATSGRSQSSRPSSPGRCPEKPSG